jgi:hypothetical protein
MATIYTPELITRITQDYLDGIPVETIAMDEDIPVRSLRAKLSALGIYKKKVYVSKTGEPPVKKEEYLDKIAAKIKCNFEVLTDLENKKATTLIKVLWLSRMSTSAHTISPYGSADSIVFNTHLFALARDSRRSTSTLSLAAILSKYSSFFTGGSPVLLT